MIYMIEKMVQLVIVILISVSLGSFVCNFYSVIVN